jgi:hypothetical protein
VFTSRQGHQVQLLNPLNVAVALDLLLRPRLQKTMATWARAACGSPRHSDVADGAAAAVLRPDKLESDHVGRNLQQKAAFPMAMKLLSDNQARAAGEEIEDFHHPVTVGLGPTHAVQQVAKLQL